jgi:hypothetical protein
MSLKKLKFASDTVKTPMGDISLRGLQLPDVRSMLRDNPAEMAMVYEQVKSVAEQYKKDPESVDLFGLFGVVVQIAPKLVAHGIALASCDEPDAEDIEIAEKLPLDVQLECIEKIASMTFALEGGARSFFGKTILLLQNMSRFKNAT